MKHWHFDSFEIEFASALMCSQTEGAKLLDTFVLNVDASIEEVKIPLVGTLKRTPEPEGPTAEALEVEAEVQAVEEV